MRPPAVTARALPGAALVLGLAVAAPAALAQSPAEFYKGKSIDLVISTEAGIAFDVSARIVARHLVRHIPGQPGIVPRNMPGAGHLRAANFIYNQAPRDGTTIGTLLPVFVTSQLVDRSDAIQFESQRFVWIGSTAWSTTTTFVLASTGVTSIEDVRKREVLMGGTGAGAYSTLFPVLMNNIIGTRFKVVAGYKGTAELNIALERGEVEGRAGVPLPSIRIERPEWLRDRKINFLVQVGLQRDPGLPEVPLLVDFARTPEERQILTLFSSDAALGRPFITTPGVPADRVAALRKAFLDTMADPEFLKEAKAASMEVLPVPGERLQAIVEELARTPADVLAKAKAATDMKGAVAPGRK